MSRSISTQTPMLVVRAICFTPEKGQVLLLHRVTGHGRSKGHWEVPGGKVERLRSNHMIEVASIATSQSPPPTLPAHLRDPMLAELAREVEEETGIQRLDFLDGYPYIVSSRIMQGGEHDGRPYLALFFIAMIQDVIIRLAPDEHDRACYLSPGAALQLHADPNVSFSLTVDTEVAMRAFRI